MPLECHHRDLTIFFDRPAATVAVDLIGAEFTIAGVGGRIIETEAYTDDDPASHSFKGQTVRNQAMFGPPASIYVYRSYGIHWCLNFVGRTGSAVLIRALEPISGLDLMRQRRGLDNPIMLCSGPGRLCQALGVTDTLNGRRLVEDPLHLTVPSERLAVSAGRRIGIKKATDIPWRFGVKGSPFLSNKL
ncbi:DNA-3-methyladenine glycosylase [Rhizobium herbae]|jgi:DNA-3-methyladenine glycosylase